MSAVTGPLVAAQFDIDQVIDQVERDRSLPIGRSLRGTRPIVGPGTLRPQRQYRRSVGGACSIDPKILCPGGTWHVSSVDCVGRDGLDLDLQGGRWSLDLPTSTV